jgi:uncharacterized protein YcgL (UPF0745 family)
MGQDSGIVFARHPGASRDDEKKPRLFFTLQSCIPERGTERMQAYVYKSRRKADTFVYLSARDDFARLPELLRAQMGLLDFVLEVALTPERKLAREDAAVVRQNLAARGFHVQFPPPVVPGENADG